MDASRYISIVRRWGWLLVLGAVFSLATYAVASRFAPQDDALPTYQASASLLVGADDQAQADIVAANDGTTMLARSYASMIDGEAVIWSQGRLDFTALQQRLGAGPKTLPGLVAAAPAWPGTTRAAVGWAVLGEPVSGFHAVGALLILPGIWLSTRR